MEEGARYPAGLQQTALQQGSARWKTTQLQRCPNMAAVHDNTDIGRYVVFGLDDGQCSGLTAWIGHTWSAVAWASRCLSSAAAASADDQHVLAGLHLLIGLLTRALPATRYTNGMPLGKDRPINILCCAASASRVPSTRLLQHRPSLTRILRHGLMSVSCWTRCSTHFEG